jgi:hypothetical protein
MSSEQQWPQTFQSNIDCTVTFNSEGTSRCSCGKILDYGWVTRPGTKFTRVLTTPAPLRELIEAAKKAVDALKTANIHLGWGDCSLENVHRLVVDAADTLAAAVAKCEERS